MAKVLNSVREISSDVFNVPLEKIAATTSPGNLELWDSVQNLNLLLAVEERFGVTFDPEEMDAMKDVGSIAALVEKKLSQ